MQHHFKTTVELLNTVLVMFKTPECEIIQRVWVNLSTFVENRQWKKLKLDIILMLYIKLICSIICGLYKRFQSKFL